MISLLDGSRSPGRSRAASSRRIAAICAILLSLSMKDNDSATVALRVAVPLPEVRRTGTALAFLGVLAFSGSFPATVYAMRGFDPWLVAIGRAVLAGIVALVCLKARRAPPDPAETALARVRRDVPRRRPRLPRLQRPGPAPGRRHRARRRGHRPPARRHRGLRRPARGRAPAPAVLGGLYGRRRRHHGVHPHQRRDGRHLVRPAPGGRPPVGRHRLHRGRHAVQDHPRLAGHLLHRRPVPPRSRRRSPRSSPSPPP